MEVSYELIRIRIRELRLAQGLSQAQLAEKAYTTMQHLNHIENGRKKPSLEMLIWIAEALRISIADLVQNDPKQGAGSCAGLVNSLLADCNDREQRVLIHALKALKQVLRNEHCFDEPHTH